MLFFNGSDSLWLDNVMWALSDTRTWALLLLVLIYKVAREYSLRHFLLFFALFGLAILLADQISSTIIKPLVCRPRPTHEPAIMGGVDVVRGYRGGMYGFVSSHAANTFAEATYVSLVVRRRLLTVSLFLWAGLVCYSRMYLGVHYPGDILCGAMLGAVVGYVCYVLFACLFPGGCIRHARFSLRPVCAEASLQGTWVIVAALLVTLLYVCVQALVAA